MTTKLLNVPVSIKAVGDQGAFEAIVSVFNNVDHDNERVMPSAFDRTLLDWRAKGQTIPVLFGHDAGAVIGSVNPTDAQVTKTDLRVKGQFDLTRRLAQEAYLMAKSGLLTQWSFGYDPRVQKIAPDGVGEIHDLDLGEFSMTGRPSNELTTTLAVKSDGVVIADGTDTPIAIIEVSADASPAELDAIRNTLNMKAGRRLSQATISELQSLRDDLGSLVTRINTLIDDEVAEINAGDESTEPAKSTTTILETDTANPAQHEHQTSDQKPMAAPPRSELDIRVEQELLALAQIKERRNGERR